MSSVNALPVLDSSTASWDLALDKKFNSTVVEAFQPNVVLFDGAYNAILKMNDADGYRGQFVQKAPDPDPDEAYTPGTELEGQQYGFREDFISLDAPLVQHAYFRFDHVDVSHFPIIEPVIRGKTEALARKLDARGFITLLKAARSNSAIDSNSATYDSQGSTNGLTVHNGGNRVTRTGATFSTAYASSSTGSANFRSDVDDLCLAMDNDNVPRDGRVLFISPESNRLLQYDTGIFDVRYAQDMSANNLQRAIIGEMSGFKVVMVANRFPTTNITSGSVPSKYQGYFALNNAKATGGYPVAIAVGGVRQGSAPVGYRQVGGIRIDRVWKPERQSWFASIAVLGGFDQMHQYCAGSIELTSD